MLISVQKSIDYMHLVCLGVVRRLMLAWLKGPLICRLPANSVREISEISAKFRSYMPSEFCRRPRSLSDIDRFKATEFPQILLYTGVVAISIAILSLRPSVTLVMHAKTVQDIEFFSKPPKRGMFLVSSRQ